MKLTVKLESQFAVNTKYGVPKHAYHVLYLLVLLINNHQYQRYV